MPDDRPESPEERLREALREIRGIARTFVEDARVRERIDQIARAALSIPAGPSPSGDRLYDLAVWARSLPHLPDPEQFAAEWANVAAAVAPSPREEAVEAAAKALHESTGDLYPWADTGETTRDMRRNQARAALSAARPSSPTPEETRELADEMVDEVNARLRTVLGRDDQETARWIVHYVTARFICASARTPGDDATTKEGR